MLTITSIQEKTMVAVSCLSEGEGAFERRLCNAYFSALAHLTSSREHPEVSDDLVIGLDWVLDVCRDHVIPNGGMSPLSDDERRGVVEKLMHLLIETTRLRG